MNAWTDKLQRLRATVCLMIVLMTLCCGQASAQTIGKQGFNLFSHEQDEWIGQQSAQAAEKKLPLIRDEFISDYLNRLGKHLAAQAPGKRYAYSFKVINAPAVNAFALPGGPIYLTRGTIEAARSEGELAGIMAHAIAHVALRHGTHQASKAYLAQAGLSVLGGVIGEKSAARMISAVGGTGFNAVFLENSRELEAQADTLGALISARAGYDPRELISFLDRLRRKGREQPDAAMFFYDHPWSSGHMEKLEREAAQLQITRSSKQIGNYDQLRAAIAQLPPSGLIRIPQPTTSAGTSARLAKGAVISPQIERASSRTLAWRAPGGAFRVNYPDNWLVWPGLHGLGVTFAPPGGIVQSNGAERIVYGVMINQYRFIGDNSEWSGRPQRGLRYIGGRGELVTAANDLLNCLLQNLPHLAFVRGSDRREINDQNQIITLTLTGRSPVTGRVERLQLYTRARGDEEVIYAIFVAPEDEYGNLRRIFEQMLRGLSIDDGALSRY